MFSNISVSYARFITSANDQKTNANLPICLFIWQVAIDSFQIATLKKVNNWIGQFLFGFWSPTDIKKKCKKMSCEYNDV